MKDEYMFLSIIGPGPRNLKEKLDVFLQPLIAELKHLWEGVYKHMMYLVSITSRCEQHLCGP